MSPTPREPRAAAAPPGTGCAEKLAPREFHGHGVTSPKTGSADPGAPESLATPCAL